MFAPESGVLADSGDFLTELAYLFLNGLTILSGIGTVGRLKRQSPDALVHVRHFVQRPFGGLTEGNPVLGIAVSLIQTVDLRGRPIRNLKTGCVILCSVDPETGCQTLKGGIKGSS